jgi:tRNA C32,U32 (ribose-2'-O)-methylase TrmJ
MRIPTVAEHGSMNLGQAVAVCLYELMRRQTRRQEPAQGAAKTGREKNLAEARDLDRLTQLLFQLLSDSGYVKPRTASATEEKCRRVVRRMELSAADAELWLGMLRQIGWKLCGNENGQGQDETSAKSRRSD